MRTVRIVATLVTGTTMTVGGIALTIHSPPLVVLLGVFCGGVGIAYTYAGLSADLTRQEITRPQRNPGGPTGRIGEATSQDAKVVGSQLILNPGSTVER